MKSCCNKKHKEIRSPLGRARGLGSAKTGFKHWWVQRLTGLALIPLSLWFLFHIEHIFSQSYDEVVACIGQPINAVGTLLFIWLSFYHAILGLEVVVEDYAPCKISKIFGLVFIRFFFISLGIMSTYAVLQINF